jgi:Protein-L-isoaspartate(D-aspartate) O-methyltransferase (PCMT)
MKKAKSLVQDIKNILAKARQIKAASGIPGLARRSIAFAYRRGVRPWLPVQQVIHYAGLSVYDRKWGDRMVPASWVPYQWGPVADEPDYEAALVAGLRETVKHGDRVVVIGGGYGITAVVAALLAGPSGAVQCFEGSQEHVRLTQRTAARNKVSNVRVHHAVVAKSTFVFGPGGDLGPVLPASQLPSCDVLQLDCEGAEVEILREMTIQPRVILVETHGVFGAPTNLVASVLEKRGYLVSDRGLAEPRLAALCTKQDVRVLLGVNK